MKLFMIELDKDPKRREKYQRGWGAYRFLIGFILPANREKQIQNLRVTLRENKIDHHFNGSGFFGFKEQKLAAFYYLMLKE